MITVQIASQLTAQGVDGVRWVLLEDNDSMAAAAPPQAQTLPAPAPTAAPRSGGWLIALKALVIVAGLGAALGLANLEFGGPVMRWQAPRPPLAPEAIDPAPALPPATPASQQALVAGVAQP